MQKALLALLIAFPSTGIIQKYAGLAGVMGYIVMVMAIIVGIAWISPRFAPWLQRHFRSLAVLSITGLGVSFVLLHPLEDNRGPGRSSDRDEGLELAVTRAFQGKTPYYPSNTTAGPLSVLPGSVVLAAPFVALGSSAYQNIFWLTVFLFLTYWVFKDRALALCLLIIPLALSPVALYEFVSGGDLIANGIFVPVFLLLALESWTHEATPAWQRWGACLLLGVGLASRANFIFLLPLLGGILSQRIGFRRALTPTLMIFLTWLVITLPFYMNDPSGFTPLLSRKKLAAADHVLPWASSAVIGFSALAAIICGFFFIFQRGLISNIHFFRWCAFISLVPMVCVIVLSSWNSGYLDFGVTRERFGLMSVFFALLGWGGQWFMHESLVHSNDVSKHGFRNCD